MERSSTYAGLAKPTGTEGKRGFHTGAADIYELSKTLPDGERLSRKKQRPISNLPIEFTAMLTDYPTEGQFQRLLEDWLNSKLNTETLLIKGNAIRDEIKARVAEKRAAEAKSKVAARSRHGVLKALGLYKEIPRTSEGNFLMETCALLFHGKDILCISDGENETEFFLPAEPTKLTPAVEEDTVRTGLVAWPRIVDHVITTYFPATTKAQRDALAYIFHGLSADNIRHFMRRASRYANSSCQAANLPHAYMIEVVFPTILNLVDETMHEIYPVIQH
ncbi:MAG: hypothetical protein EBY29_17665, partial [Planctomycetes bacterium]|nr:hypothetical protein [Planctomycetota bacterium]